MKKKSHKTQWRDVCLCAVAIVVAGMAAYANSFRGMFILDDLAAIPGNPSIRHLWPVTSVLFPEPGQIEASNTVEGRPLLNLSFAMNYAVHGLEVWGYHAVNLAIHLAAGLLLFGVVRRTLLLPSCWKRAGKSASWLALMVALIWVVHPLQTESVTYVAQRAETLVGCFYLLTMYLAVRSFEPSTSRGWRLGAVLACVMGMAAKEVMVTAPLLVLLYDVFFVAGSLRSAWLQRRGFYLSLMLLGWGTLAAIMISTSGSNLGNVKSLLYQVAGRDDAQWEGHDMQWFEYGRIQLWAVLRYVRLVFWPSPLVFAYSKYLPDGMGSPAPLVLILGLMMAATLWGCWKKSWVGFAALWFFLILMPTSSVVPLSGQTVAEHRMYLPLAGVVTLVVVGGYLAWDRMCRRGGSGSQGGAQFTFAAMTLLLVFTIVILGWKTFERNRDYLTEISIWQDTVNKWPWNASALNNLGAAYFDAGKFEEAIANYRRSLALKPRYVGARNNLGLALSRTGRLEEAVEEFNKALTVHPEFADAHNNLGFTLYQMGRVDEAVTHYEKVLQSYPDAAGVHFNLGKARVQRGELLSAIQHFESSLRTEPNFAEGHHSLATTLLQAGRTDEAIAHFEKAIALKPALAQAHYNLGLAFVQKGRMPEAKEQFQAALEHKRDFAEAHTNLGLIHYREANGREALDHYERSVKINPREPNALNNLAWVLATSPDASLRDGSKAVELAQRADELSGRQQADFLRTLAAAYAEAGRYVDAEEASGRALNRAMAQGNSAMADVLRDEREHYRAGKPLRDEAAQAP